MSVPAELDDFHRRPASFSWSFVRSEGRVSFLRLVSGEWMGHQWTHDIVLVEPTQPRSADTAVLYITGGDPNDADIAEAESIAERSGVPVALLFHIPNQPIWDRMEDDLIAHTFEQYIETGDPEWPLLFPMVRSALRALDTLQAFSDGQYQRFILTGASKRGWTTWLAAASGDERIAGIAPMVFDHLNFPVQMAHQLDTWGEYSEQISDYTDRELPGEIDNPRGASLARMIDPYNYLQRVSCPILIINGANDRYWTVDALSNYWDALPEPKHCLIVPNAGHVLGDKVQMIETLAEFAAVIALKQNLPKLEMVSESRTWTAASKSGDFRDSVWQLGPVSGENTAAFREFRFEGITGPYSLTTLVKSHLERSRGI